MLGPGGRLITLFVCLAISLARRGYLLRRIGTKLLLQAANYLEHSCTDISAIFAFGIILSFKVVFEASLLLLPFKRDVLHE